MHHELHNEKFREGLNVISCANFRTFDEIYLLRHPELLPVTMKMW